MKRFAIALLLAGCAPPSLADFGPDEVPAEPSYATDVAPILAEYCVRCHDRSAQMDGGVELAQYLEARGARVKLTCTAVAPDIVDEFGDVLLPRAGNGSPIPCDDWHVYSMPPGATPRLTRAEQYVLAQWVATGGQP